MDSRIRTALLASVCGVALTGATAAGAADTPPQSQPPTQSTSADQDQSQTSSAQVVVTAEKRAQTLANVPLPVQAIQPAQIQKLGASDVGDLIKLIPGAAMVASFGPGFDTVEIRGIAAGQFGDGLVGYYVDDTPFGIPNIQVSPPAGLLDLNRIEVIRGASGTLYGQGSMGGAIKLVTNQPNSRTFSGQAFAETSFTEGGAENYDVGGVLNLPVVEDKFAVRMAGEYSDLSGYAAAPELHLTHANGVESGNFRIAAEWTPTNDVSVSGYYWYIRDQQDFSDFLSALNPPTVSAAGGVRGDVDVTMNIVAGTLHWSSPVGDLTANSSYFTHDLGLVFPFPLPLFGLVFPGLVDDTFKTHQFTQEVRLASKEGSPVTWLVGGYYRDATINNDLLENFDLSSIGFGNDAPINATGPLTTKAWAVYGQASVPLFDDMLEPLVGLRYDSDDRSFSPTEYATFPRFLTPPEPQASKTWTSLDPRFNLKYKPVPDGMIYVNVAKGFRSGSIQTEDQAIAASLALGAPIGTIKTIVNPDSLWTYEVGTRWELAERSLVVEASAYHTDWRNVTFDLTLPPSNILAVFNAGNARIDGVDFGLDWKTPVEGLSFSANGDVNNAKMVTVLSAIAAQTNIKPGARIPNVPADNFSVSGTYAHPLELFGGSSMTLFAAYAFRDREIDPTVTAGGLPAQSGQLNDLTLRATLRKGGWYIDAFALNALNDKGPATLTTIPYPRRAGVRVGVNF